MNLNDSLAADRAGNLKAAATGYEELLASGDSSLGVLLNLALLYWQSTDPGVAAARQLGADFLAVAGRRVPEILADAQLSYPRSTEVRFWRRYIAWADLGEPFSADECRGLLQEDPGTRIPAMHIFAISQGHECEEESLALLRECDLDGTTRAQYVASVIRGVLRRVGHQ